MKYALIAALAAATALAHAPAFANSNTYTLALEGSGFYQSAMGFLPDVCYDGAAIWPLCQAGIMPVDWTGSLTVTTADAGDGTYADGSGLEALSLSTNYGQFSFHQGDGQTESLNPGAPPGYLLGLEPGASVTVHDGRVSSVDAVYDADSGNFQFSGLGANTLGVLGDIGQPSDDNWQLQGLLASAIPEPVPALMLAGGLGLLAIGRRRTKATSRTAA